MTKKEKGKKIPKLHIVSTRTIKTREPPVYIHRNFILSEERATKESREHIIRHLVRPPPFHPLRPRCESIEILSSGDPHGGRSSATAGIART